VKLVDIPRKKKVNLKDKTEEFETNRNIRKIRDL
jgi:hypothetical protein